MLRSKDVEPNPAAWDRLRERLSKARAEVVERAAMPAADIPAFLAAHAPANGDVEQRALRFVILTAVRRKEALEAKWNEFDLTERGWRIPASRMKQDDGRTYPMRVIRAALAHGKQNAENEANAVTARYLRSDQFQARRKLMEHWSHFVTGG